MTRELLDLLVGDCGSGFMRINDYTPCGKLQLHSLARFFIQSLSSHLVLYTL